MWKWCKGHAGMLAIVFAVATLVLAVVTGFQAAMLHSKGWRIPLGTLPEYLAGAGTIFTAIGAVAAYLTLKGATRDWESAELERQSLEKERQATERERQAADKERRALAEIRENERRDEMMAQARRILLVPVPHDSSVHFTRGWFEWAIQNRSDDAISDLHIDQISPKDGRSSVCQLQPDSFPNGAAIYVPPTYIPVLVPGDSSPPLKAAVSGTESASHVEYIGFTFTDARGIRWRRLGGSQPVRILDDEPEST